MVFTETICTKLMQQGWAIQAYAEYQPGLIHRTVSTHPYWPVLATRPDKNRSPHGVGGLQHAQLLCVDRAVDAGRTRAASCHTSEHWAVSVVAAAQASGQGTAHLLMLQEVEDLSTDDPHAAQAMRTATYDRRSRSASAAERLAHLCSTSASIISVRRGSWWSLHHAATSRGASHLVYLCTAWPSTLLLVVVDFMMYAGVTLSPLEVVSLHGLVDCGVAGWMGGWVGLVIKETTLYEIVILLYDRRILSYGMQFRNRRQVDCSWRCSSRPISHPSVTVSNDMRPPAYLARR